MDNFAQAGEILPFTAPSGGVVKGRPVLIGSLGCVPCVTADQTVKFSAAITGVFEYTRLTGGSSAWTEGLKIYWDESAKKFTKVSSTDPGDFLAGVAARAAGDSDATGFVRFDGFAR